MVAEGTAALSSPFGYLLGPSWEVLGASWAPKWTPKSPPRAILDCVTLISRYFPIFFTPLPRAVGKKHQFFLVSQSPGDVLALGVLK